MKKMAQMWWADNHPLDNVVMADKYFPNVCYSEIEDGHIEYVFKKELEKSLEESK